ncbi:hypothetical protein [Streptomyces sp. NBC_00878]|uniref:hypothetical protein n=1 Tax=Streptomyces sp. NBC_00878 TaxID=2975854 RepID=UPI0022505D39|nr:hypothetical protein [Streptomyces sp. NBC_00878]MCX4910038.1 hypothetical protein [Streptomyces sp. NBC_00878]
MKEGDVGESRAPDFFDRLIARHAPAAAPRSGVARVRPRLAGPFERVEAVRAGTQEPDAVEPLWPTSAQSPTSDGDLARPAVREVQLRTERERTVVRAERAPSDEPAPRPARDLTEAPLLRPAVPVAPGPRPVPDTTRRTSGRGEPERPSSPSAVSTPFPSGAATASPAAMSAALRPSSADTAAARDAVRQAAGRRSGRGGEQVVQVQIGRLEVTAAGPATAGGGSRGRAAPARQGATVTLAEYLARGRE